MPTPKTDKPIGSGCFAVFVGVVLCVSSAQTLEQQLPIIDTSKPGFVLAAWNMLAGLMLLTWGATRILNTTARDNFTIGQDTINTVTAIFAVTFTIWAVIASKP